jgi:[FeFe] hydrogenase H-cluster maturation GTPase HydF
VVKEREVDWALSQLGRLPDLAITDSQVVLKAAGSVPEEVPLTTFSVLFSRFKGDLARFVEGASAIDRLEHGDRVLLAESCTHHAHSDDIGRVKIPRWLRHYTGKELDITVQGGSYPDDIADYALVIHCGACMLTRNMVLGRMDEAAAAGVPVTNYGIAISHLHGLLDRVLVPFRDELD